MFKNYEYSAESVKSPLLELLLPHFEEIFDEIDVESVVITTNSELDGFEGTRKEAYRIQGVVTISEAKNRNTAFSTTSDSGSVTAVLVEWKSSPMGTYVLLFLVFLSTGWGISEASSCEL